MDRSVLLSIRRNDPDGGYSEPTERDYEDFRMWVLSSYGADAWKAYNRDGWDDPEF